MIDVSCQTYTFFIADMDVSMASPSAVTELPNNDFNRQAIKATDDSSMNYMSAMKKPSRLPKPKHAHQKRQISYITLVPSNRTPM